MSKFDLKKNTFTITENENGTFTFESINPHSSCLNYVGGSADAVSSHFKKLLTNTLQRLTENRCKSITFIITTNDE